MTGFRVHQGVQSPTNQESPGPSSTGGPLQFSKDLTYPVR